MKKEGPKWLVATDYEGVHITGNRSRVRIDSGWAIQNSIHFSYNGTCRWEDGSFPVSATEILFTLIPGCISTWLVRVRMLHRSTKSGTTNSDDVGLLIMNLSLWFHRFRNDMQISWIDNNAMMLFPALDRRTWRFPPTNNALLQVTSFPHYLRVSLVLSLVRDTFSEVTRMLSEKTLEAPLRLLKSSCHGTHPDTFETLVDQTIRREQYPTRDHFDEDNHPQSEHCWYTLKVNTPWSAIEFPAILWQ